MSAASFVEIASFNNAQHLASNYQGSSLNNSVIARPKKQVTFIDDLALYWLSVGGRMNNNSCAENMQEFMDLQQPWKNGRDERYFSLKWDNLEEDSNCRRRSFSLNDAPSDTESIHSVQSTLDGIALRCSSADGVRKRPSRKVVCNYIEKSPNFEKNKKECTRTVISQAVFPDENNPRAATPVLRLKKAKQCSKCQRNTTLCACKLAELRIDNNNSNKIDRSTSDPGFSSCCSLKSGSAPVFIEDPGKPPVSHLNTSSVNLSLQRVEFHPKQSDDKKLPKQKKFSTNVPKQKHSAGTVIKNNRTNKLRVHSIDRKLNNEKSRSFALKPSSNQANYAANYKYNRQQNELAHKASERFVPIQIPTNYQIKAEEQCYNQQQTNFRSEGNAHSGITDSKNRLSNLKVERKVTTYEPKFNQEIRSRLTEIKKSNGIALRCFSPKIYNLKNVDALPDNRLFISSQRSRHQPMIQEQLVSTRNARRKFQDNIVTESHYVRFACVPISKDCSKIQASNKSFFI